jgi:tetratricopeptide (TPR) repeat protein
MVTNMKNTLPFFILRMEVSMKKTAGFFWMIAVCCIVLSGCGKGESSYRKGMEAVEAGDYQTGETYLKKALQENKERAEYYIGYGMILNHLGRYEEAVEQFEKARQDVDNSIANANNKQVYYGEAVSYYYLEEYEKGLELCEKALEFAKPASLDSKIYCSKGVLEEACGDVQGAMESYQKVISLDSRNWQAYYRMSRIYQNQEDEDAAGQSRAFLETADEEGETAATYYLGMLYLGQEDISQGKKYLEKYISSEDVDKETDNFLVSAYNQLATYAIQESDLELAEEYLEKGKSIAGEEQGRQLWKNQIILLEQQGEYGQACQVAKEYLQEYPQDKEIKKEYRFLKTRDTVAKGNETVAETSGEEQENITE